jgi:hypothetical protein
MVYGDYSLAFRLCYTNSWQPWGLDREACRLDDEAVVLARKPQGETFPLQREVPYSAVIVFAYDERGQIALLDDLVGVSALGYRPMARLTPSAPLPERSETLLGLQ